MYNMYVVSQPFDVVNVIIIIIIVILVVSGGFRGGRAGSAPPPFGDGLTPSLEVMLANAKF